MRMPPPIGGPERYTPRQAHGESGHMHIMHIPMHIIIPLRLILMMPASFRTFLLWTGRMLAYAKGPVNRISV